VVWATSDEFARDAQAAVEGALRQPRDRTQTAHDVQDMRGLMERERPPRGAWDLKLSPGGLVDIEFAAQFLQIVHAAEGGPLRPNTAEALAALQFAGLAPAAPLQALSTAWTLQQNLTQLLKVAFESDADPSAEPRALKALLARAGGAATFAALVKKLDASRVAARAAYEAIVRP
jgi:[glutamine synthetase] adenylyltransferase / [glutamine synthetase]-adenylyl-L-tyrosine phosphorylase